MPQNTCTTARGYTLKAFHYTAPTPLGASGSSPHSKLDVIFVFQLAQSNNTITSRCMSRNRIGVDIFETAIEKRQSLGWVALSGWKTMDIRVILLNRSTSSQNESMCPPCHASVCLAPSFREGYVTRSIFIRRHAVHNTSIPVGRS